MTNNNEFDVRLVPHAEFYAFVEGATAEVMNEHSYFDATKVLLDDAERAALSAIKLDMGQYKRVLIGAYERGGTRPIGWSESVQRGHQEIAMHLSAVRPEFRGRGIYTRMLKLAMAEARRLGFQKITSYHHATNNAVLIPKLKAGFNIVGFELKEDAGAMVKLAYYFNAERHRFLKFRAGQVRPDEKIWSVLTTAGGPRMAAPRA